MVSKNRAILIRNSHGASRTSMERAAKYVAAGRARFIGDRTIEFLDNERHWAVGRGIRPNYTDGGMATLGAIAGLPVLMPVRLITLRSRRRPRAQAAA